MTWSAGIFVVICKIFANPPDPKTNIIMTKVINPDKLWGTNGKLSGMNLKSSPDLKIIKGTAEIVIKAAIP